jgi:GntR family transcriptional regulator/MocR family aminotransferase
MVPIAQNWETPPSLIYVLPSSQCPTGSALSLERRLALLAGLARKQRVIYLGTFSRVMFPDLPL